MAQKQRIKRELLATEIKMSFSHSFSPEQEDAEIHKGVLFLSHGANFWSNGCFVANFRRFQFHANFRRPRCLFLRQKVGSCLILHCLRIFCSYILMIKISLCTLLGVPWILIPNLWAGEICTTLAMAIPKIGPKRTTTFLFVPWTPPDSKGKWKIYDIGYPTQRSQKYDHFPVCSLDPSSSRF